MIANRLTVIIGTVVIAASVALGWWINGNRLTAQHADYVATQQAASVAVITRLLEQERDHAARIETIQVEAEAEILALADTASSVAADNKRLQQSLSDLSRRYASDATVTASCEDAATAARVSAELLGELSGLAEVYAGDSAAVRLALGACIASHEALRGK